MNELVIRKVENGFIIMHGYVNGPHLLQSWVAKDVPDLLAVIARIYEDKKEAKK